MADIKPNPARLADNPSGLSDRRRRLNHIDQLLRSGRLTCEETGTSLDAAPLIGKAQRLLALAAREQSHPPNRRLAAQLEYISGHAETIAHLVERASQLEEKTTPAEDAFVITFLCHLEDATRKIRSQLRRERLRQLLSAIVSSFKPRQAGRLLQTRTFRTTAWIVVSTVIMAAVGGWLIMLGWPQPGCLMGTYFADENLQSVVGNRCDKRIDFDWSTSPPMANIPNTEFSVAWRGLLRVPENDEYTFYLTSDDGSRLLVNGGLAIEHWGLHAATTEQATIGLAKGQATIHLMYFQRQGAASLRLEWSSNTFARRVIDEHHLIAP